jgi:hypothetical protein
VKIIWETLTPEQQNNQLIVAAVKVRSIQLNKAEDAKGGKTPKQEQAGK